MRLSDVLLKVIWRDERLQCLKLLINLCELMLLCDLQKHGFNMRKLLHDLIDWKFQTSLWDSVPFHCDLLAILRLEKAKMVAIDNILKWPANRYWNLAMQTARNRGILKIIRCFCDNCTPFVARKVRMAKIDNIFDDLLEFRDASRVKEIYCWNNL